MDKVQINNPLYAEIEKLCDEKGVKVATMCNAIGIRHGLLSDLKYGRTEFLSAQNIWKIAQYFGVSTDVLCSTADQIKTQEGGK